MSSLNPVTSRRALLRGMAALSLLLILPNHLVTVAATTTASIQICVYGQGTYNQGVYPGEQKIYLPLVKEGN